MITFKNLLIWTKTATMINLTETTKCQQKCEKTKVSFFLVKIVVYKILFQYTVTEKEALDKVLYKKDWISEVYFQPGSNSVGIRKEYYAYDIFDVLGDVGGYLGLFLGWSLQDISINFFNLIFAYIFLKTYNQ